MARELVVGECAQVRRIIVGVRHEVRNGRHSVGIDFIDPLYIPEMALYQGQVGVVTHINEDDGQATVVFRNIGNGEDFDFRIVDLDWASPYTRDQDTLSMVQRGFYDLR